MATAILLRALVNSLLLNMILLAMLADHSSKNQKRESVYKRRGMLFI